MSGESDMQGFGDLRNEARPDAQGENGEPYERSGEAQLVDWTPCERTVRLCIDALPDFGAVFGYSKTETLALCREALEALLPKKDPAEELAMELICEFVGASGERLTTDMLEALKAFVRRLISTGRIGG